MRTSRQPAGNGALASWKLGDSLVALLLVWLVAVDGAVLSDRLGGHPTASGAAHVVATVVMSSQ
jgi:hypothetical protein